MKKPCIKCGSIYSSLFCVGYVCWCFPEDEINIIHVIREIPKRQLQCPGCIYAIVKRRGGRSLDFRFYDANLHNLENLGPPKAVSTMLWSSVRTPIVTIIQWWSDEIKLCQHERSNVVFWSLSYLLFLYIYMLLIPPSNSTSHHHQHHHHLLLMKKKFGLPICMKSTYVYYIEYMCFCTFQPMINCWLRVVIYHPRQFSSKEILL